MLVVLLAAAINACPALTQISNDKPAAPLAESDKKAITDPNYSAQMIDADERRSLAELKLLDSDPQYVMVYERANKTEYVELMRLMAKKEFRDLLWGASKRRYALETDARRNAGYAAMEKRLWKDNFDKVQEALENEDVRKKMLKAERQRNEDWGPYLNSPAVANALGAFDMRFAKETRRLAQTDPGVREFLHSLALYEYQEVKELDKAHPGFRDAVDTLSLRRSAWLLDEVQKYPLRYKILNLMALWKATAQERIWLAIESSPHKHRLEIKRKRWADRIAQETGRRLDQNRDLLDGITHGFCEAFNVKEGKAKEEWDRWPRAKPSFADFSMYLLKIKWKPELRGPIDPNVLDARAKFLTDMERLPDYQTRILDPATAPVLREQMDDPEMGLILVRVNAEVEDLKANYRPEDGVAAAYDEIALRTDWIFARLETQRPTDGSADFSEVFQEIRWRLDKKKLDDPRLGDFFQDRLRKQQAGLRDDPILGPISRRLDWEFDLTLRFAEWYRRISDDISLERAHNKKAREIEREVSRILVENGDYRRVKEESEKTKLMYKPYREAVGGMATPD